MKWIRKLNILQYSIFSYIFFFALIFIPMSLVWYTTSRHSVTQQLELSSKNALLQAKASFESDLSQLDLISQQLPYDSAISLEYLADPYENIDSRSALAKYRLNNSMIEEAYLFYPEDPETFYSANGSTKIDALIELRQQNVDKEELLTLLNAPIPSFSILEEKVYGDKSFFYVVPIQDAFGKNSASMIYVLRKSSIDAIFSPLLNEAHGDFYLVNSQDKLLGFSNNNPELATALNKKLATKGSLSESFRWENKNYLLHQFTNDLLDLEYVYVLNTDLASARLTQIYQASIYTIIGILIIGLFSSIFLGRHSYRPYEKIERLLLKHEHEQPQKRALSFEEVHGKLSTFLTENSHLKEEIKQQTPFIKESLLHQLLTGQRTDELSLQELFSPLIIQQATARYFMIVISFEATSHSPALYRDSFSNQLLKELNHIQYAHFEWCGTKCLEEEAVTFLIASSGELTQEEIVERIVEDMRNFSDVTLPIGIGKETASLKGIKHSFIEALTALDYRFENPQGQIFFFESISASTPQDHRSFHFPEDKQLKLVQSLHLGNEGVALETLEELIHYGVQYCVTLQTFRMYSYYIMNTYAHVGIAVIGDALLTELEVLIDVKDYQQLHKKLQEITQMICQKVATKAREEESHVKEALFSYIDAHYNTDFLSLESISDHFNLTPTMINKIMKEETNTTFAKYIANLRLEKIKQALVETDQSIKEIIQSNGYYDVSNFTRKFRTTVGVTPGQYRTMYREG